MRKVLDKQRRVVIHLANGQVVQVGQFSDAYDPRCERCAETAVPGRPWRGAHCDAEARARFRDKVEGLWYPHVTLPDGRQIGGKALWETFIAEASIADLTAALDALEGTEATP